MDAIGNSLLRAFQCYRPKTDISQASSLLSPPMTLPPRALQRGILPMVSTMRSSCPLYTVTLTPASSNSSTMLMTGFMKSPSMFRKTLLAWPAHEKGEVAAWVLPEQEAPFSPEHPGLQHSHVTTVRHLTKTAHTDASPTGPNQPRYPCPQWVIQRGSTNSTHA